MAIFYIDVAPALLTDKLDQLFDLQKKYDGFIAKHRPEANASREEWVKRMAIAIIMEAGELLDSVSWKWWKNREEPNWPNVEEEIVDLLHFWLSLCHHVGLDASKVFKIYTAKNLENFARQRGESTRKGYKIRDNPPASTPLSVLCPKCKIPLREHEDFQYCE